MDYVIVHDLGTTCCKTVLFSKSGCLKSSIIYPYPTTQTSDGGFEQDPQDWWLAIEESTRGLLQSTGISPKSVAGISLSGHMMGVVALDRYFQPVRPAILHSDIRSRPQVDYIKSLVDPLHIHMIAGNPLDVHYPFSKIAWLRDNEQDNYKNSRQFVQSKDYISCLLTGEEPVTDWSDASLYGCFDYQNMCWSDELCQITNLEIEKLPPIREAGTLLGYLTGEAAVRTGLIQGTPVFCGFGDGAAAAIGSGSWAESSIYTYVGSTAWVSMTTVRPTIDAAGRLFTLALTENRFSAIGTVQCAGAAWEWAVERFCGGNYQIAESLASDSLPGANAIIFLPYLCGERSPIWNYNARGVWFGLSTSHTVGDMLRSVVEEVSLALAGVHNEIRRLTSLDVEHICLIGGGVRSTLWRRILAGAFEKRIMFPDEPNEATARGALIAAAVGLGWISGFDDSLQLIPENNSLEPEQVIVTAGKAAMPLFNRLYQDIRNAFEDLGHLRVSLNHGNKDNAAV